MKARRHDEPSQHSEGRAFDLMIPTTSSGGVRAEIGNPIVDLVKSEGTALGIQLMIYNRRKWGSSYPHGKEYNGRHPHYDHIHVSMTREAGRKLNYATVEALLGGAGAAATPEIDGVTHTVSTTGSSLNVRSGATTSASVIGKLPHGTPVAADSAASRTADGHSWTKVKAGYGGRIVEGWVADEFLTSTSTDAGRPSAAGNRNDDIVVDVTDAAMYRVATRASDLRMRSEPTTTSDDNIIIELPKGTEVSAVSDAVQRRDGHPWLKVRATLGGQTHDGWVAMDLLERIEPT
jgi:hypothetical protein